jgi:hypothetical protein
LEYDYIPEKQVSMWEDTDYRMWICLGCDTALIDELTWLNSQDLIDYQVHPIRNVEHRQTKQYQVLPTQLSKVYQEIITSYNSNMHLACGILLRALLEGIIVNQGITDTDAWGLEEKLSALEKNKRLPENIVHSLEGFKFIGDNVAHRLTSPRADELSLAIDVIEDLLNFLYEVEYSLETRAKIFSTALSRKIQLDKERKEKEREARALIRRQKKKETQSNAGDHTSKS